MQGKAHLQGQTYRYCSMSEGMSVTPVGGARRKAEYPHIPTNTMFEKVEVGLGDKTYPLWYQWLAFLMLFVPFGKSNKERLRGVVADSQCLCLGPF
jgi:hypothetical protein